MATLSGREGIWLLAVCGIPGNCGIPGVTGISGWAS